MSPLPFIAVLVGAFVLMLGVLTRSRTAITCGTIGLLCAIAATFLEAAGR